MTDTPEKPETPAEATESPETAAAPEAAATPEAAEVAATPDVEVAPEAAAAPVAEAIVEEPKVAVAVAPAPHVTPLNPIWAVGRRKAATARVRMFPGGGNVIVNGRPLDTYFCRLDHQRGSIAPMLACGVADQIDVRVNVRGGGITGQAGAVRLGVARALAALRPDLEAKLRDKNFMTRDARVVERKKYGRAGARRGFQFSKR